MESIARPSGSELSLARELARFTPGDDTFHALRGGDAVALRGKRTSFALLPPPASEMCRRLLRRFPHGGAIADAADRHEIDALLVAAVVEAESGFDARVVSARGAAGLMQIMPALAGTEAGELLNPTVNLDLGARYMSHLVRHFSGDLELALAAYNAGPGAVRRFGGVPPYKETTRFVQRVLSLYQAHRMLALAEDEAHRTEPQQTASGRTAR